MGPVLLLCLSHCRNFQHTKTAPHLIYDYRLGKYLATAKAFDSFLPTCRSRLCSFYELSNRYPPRHCITRSIILWQDGKPPSQRNPLMLTCGVRWIEVTSGYTTMPPSPPKILRERDLDGGHFIIENCSSRLLSMLRNLHWGEGEGDFGVWHHDLGGSLDDGSDWNIEGSKAI